MPAVFRRETVKSQMCCFTLIIRNLNIVRKLHPAAVHQMNDQRAYDRKLKDERLGK